MVFILLYTRPPSAERRSTNNLVYPILVTVAALHQVGLVDTSPYIYVLNATSLAKLNGFQQLVTDTVSVGVVIIFQLTKSLSQNVSLTTGS